MAKKSSKGNNAKEKKVPHIVEHVSDSSDEEIDEDEAFNSDDERKYGALFSAANKSNKKKAQIDSKASSDADDDASYSVSEGDESDDDDDDSSTGLAGSDDDASDGDGGQYMLDLLNNMDKKSPKEEEQKNARKDALAMTQHSSLIQESEFSAAAVQSSQLTLDQLMNGITDTKGFGVVQKTMSQMVVSNNKSNILDDDNKAISVTKAPVSRVVSERASRKVHYEEQKDEVSRWTDVVKQNREAETLDFRSNNQKNSRVTRDTLVEKFEPTTDFEKELAQMLEKAGDEKQMMEQEQNALIAGTTESNNGEDYDDEDDLGSGKISMEEYKKRMGELSKMRALLFYEEQKRHHINKIKSKKYRKIRKKKRDKEKEAEFDDDDPDAVRELEEKEEMERMKERMTLAHKNTSKWAKRVLRRGGKIDMDTRKALSAQIRIGDDLRKKMMGEHSDDDDEEYNNMDPIDQARALLLETEKDETNSSKKTKKSSLLEMSFMQKGIESQRQRAKEEARELLAELEANQEEDEHNDSDSSSEDVPTKKKRKKVASDKETEKIITKGSMVAKGLQFGNSTSITVSGPIDLDANNNNKNESMKVSSSTDDTIVGELKSTKNKKKNIPGLLPKGETKVTKTTSSQLAVNHKTSSSSRNNANTSTSNPWLVQDDDEEEQTITTTSNKKNITSNSSSSKKKKTTIVDISGAANIIVSNSDDSLSEENKTISNNDTADSKNTDVDSNSKLVTLSQEELVRRAFAAPSEKELDEEFEKEKDAMRERDESVKKKKKNDRDTMVSGWGSWAGDGAPPPKPPKFLPKRLQAPTTNKKKRRRQDDGKKNVIINEKRVKKNAKFQIENIPYPFTSREQYEKAMHGGVGYEWNVTGAVKEMTRAEVITRAGKMIQPIHKKSKTKKQKRAPAKF